MVIERQLHIPDECIVGHSIHEVCQEYVTEQLEQLQQEQFSRDAIIKESGPRISADNTDYRNFHPVAVKIYRNLSGELLYGMTQGVQTTDDSGGESLPIVMGSSAVAIPADRVLSFPKVPEITISLPGIGTILTKLGMGALMAGAMNLASPRVQEENLTLVHDRPVEVGSTTIWMAKNSEEAEPKESWLTKLIKRWIGKKIYNGSSGKSAPQQTPPEREPVPEKEPAPKRKPASEREPVPEREPAGKSKSSGPPKPGTSAYTRWREKGLTAYNDGVRVFIVRNGSMGEFQEIFNHFGTSTLDYVVVRSQPNIGVELRVGRAKNPNAMVLLGENVIAAGKISLGAASNNISINGNNPIYRTSRNGMLRREDAAWKADPHAGLNYAAEFIRGLVGSREISWENTLTGSESNASISFPQVE